MSASSWAGMSGCSKSAEPPPERRNSTLSHSVRPDTTSSGPGGGAVAVFIGHGMAGLEDLQTSQRAA